MPNEPMFRYSVPQLPAGKPISAEEAEKILLQRLRDSQDDPEDALWQLARFYSVTGRQHLAFPYVEQLQGRTTDPEKKAACYLAMGQLMEQVRDFEAAIQYYSQALSLEPVNNSTWYFIHNNLGYCLNHFGRYAEALPYLTRAVGIDPLRFNAYKNLGIALEGHGDYAGAAVCFIKAVQTNASDPRALRHLEALVGKHPTVAVDVKDFELHLKACRAAVEQVAVIQREAIEQWQGNAPKA